ncbi:MAG: SAM-dependent methyltransferase, partial [Luteibaculaceae bacterium]
MSSKGTLFLVPNGLGGPLQEVLPNTNANAIAQVEHFVIESFKGGRSLIKQLGKNPDEAKSIELLNEHSKVEDLRNLLNPALQGNSIALMSDAGCPAIADPGAGLVSLAHELGIPVVPLVGPSSILLALMGSGFNGQQFTFNGYLPKEPRERTKTVQHLLRLALQGNTQLFMETPYRNTKLLEEIGQ